MDNKKLLLSAKDIEIEFTLRGKVLKAIRKCSKIVKRNNCCPARLSCFGENFP